MAWGTGIKSVQRGTVAAGATATITAVVMAKTFLNFLGFTSTHTSGLVSDAMPKIVLTNTTTITCSNGGGAEDALVSFEAIEYY